MKYIVFGLGSYGAAVATKLVELGHEVFGVDSQQERTEKNKNKITYVVTLDATNRDAILDLPLKEADAIIIAIGDNEGVIIMVAALLKQIGVKRIITRVISELQKTVLETMGLNEFVYPEQNSADRMANTLSLPGMVLDSYRVCDQYRVFEVNLPSRLMGSQVSEAGFDHYDIMLVTVKRKSEAKNLLGATYEKLTTLGRVFDTFQFKSEDRLVLFGEPRKLRTFIEQQ
ncbi:MAG TPA: TrkA family potassium uptake protein [Chryseolinea sp.]|nr:TrkA family potassium uptake protein [Chryseolinea sp.]HPM31910.1 TrkA family potassium uptake protein [Chryseolinea sp.]